MTDNKELEIYIHIPFCKRKCNYCDFLSAPCNEETQARYFDALVSEIRSLPRDLKERLITSVYIGGGTPTLPDGKYISQICDALRDEFTHMNENLEFSIECNPGTVSHEKLEGYKNSGINRLSIGLQSADAKELKSLGRIHTFEEFLRTYETAREVGFQNINIDLMQSVPFQTLSSWKETLKKVTELEPEHISAYSLIIEEGTPFYEMFSVEENMSQLPDEDVEREIYYYTKEYLENLGYRRYEISNYSKPGKECQHNIGYWQRKDYIGLGIGAASLIDNVRWSNTRNLERYIGLWSGRSNAKAQDENDQCGLDHDEKNCGNDIRENTEILTTAAQMEEFMFLGLRMTEGISKQKFEKTFSVSYEQIYDEVTEKLLEQELVKIESEEFIALTEKGIDVSNMVLAEFLLDPEG